jgi:hypothetical protein
MAGSAGSTGSTGSAEITSFLKVAKSDAEIMAHMLAEIRKRVVATSAPAQLMPNYRVAISAHGYDVVYKTRPTHATGVHPCSQVVFTFQQTLHGFPSFGCPTSIHAEGVTDSDFRIRLFHILSRIQFENPELLNHSAVVQEYQCQLFRQLYGEQLSSIIEPDEMSEHQSKYGRRDEAFVESLDACHALRREYTLLPNSLKKAQMHYLEYTDAEMARVFLLPGISVLAAHVVSRDDRLGVHCNLLTSRYGIWVDCFTGISQPARYNVDIFEMAEATVRSSAMSGSKSTSVAEKLGRINTRYRGLVSELGTVRMRRFCSAVVGVSTDLTDKCNTNDELMDCVMSHINSGKWVNVKNVTKRMNTFFTKFEGNLSEWLVDIVGSTSPSDFIERLLQCKIYDVLTENATFQELCREIKMNKLHIRELAIFARKVFVLFKFSESTFYGGDNDPNIMVSSDDIIGLIREHYEMVPMQQQQQQQQQAARYKLPFAPAVFILDQVCRSCHSPYCKSTHGVDQFHNRGGYGGVRRRTRSRSHRRHRNHRHRNGNKTRYRIKM